MPQCRTPCRIGAGLPAVVAAWLLLLAGVAAAQTPGLRLVTGGLQRPVAMAHAGDRRLFVVEQGGRIRIVAEGRLLATPFLDLDALVLSSDDPGGANEQGLLGLAFHPDYAVAGADGEGLFWVNYTDLAGDTVVARYWVSADDPDVADPASAVVVLAIEQTAGNHNGGQLQFGPLEGVAGRRYLYIGMGDGGGGNDPFDAGQSDTTLLGKLLRIDPSTAPVAPTPAYALPPDNPNAGAGLPLGSIWAKGLRNPWRFSFDALTGDLYIADVGQVAREEIDFQAAGGAGGANYGWKIMEGSICRPPSVGCDQAGLELPVFDYARAGGRCAVIGGHVYRGRRYPALDGIYFLADFCSRELFTLVRSDAGAWSGEFVLRAPTNPLTFSEDVNGELHVGGNNGAIYQLVDLDAPVALGPGLGWFSPPVQVPAGFTCADLGALAGAGEVSRLDPVSQQFETCEDGGAPPFAVRDGEGYLLSVAAATPPGAFMQGMPSCPPLDLYAGLNLVGVANAGPGTGCFGLLARIGSGEAVASVQGFDSRSGRVQTCAYAAQTADASPVGIDFPIQPDSALLVSMHTARAALSLHDASLCAPP